MKRRTKRITKFTVETERVFVFRSHDALRYGWCHECRTETQLATLAEAARAADVTELTICQLIDSHGLHFREDAERRVLVCLNSLRRKK